MPTSPGTKVLNSMRSTYGSDELDGKALFKKKRSKALKFTKTLRGQSSRSKAASKVG